MVVVLLGAARLGMLAECDGLEVNAAGRQGGHDAQRLVGLWRQETPEEVGCLVRAMVRTVHE
mgnify:CR=1 FL=1